MRSILLGSGRSAGLRVGQVGRAIDPDRLAVGQHDLVLHRRRRGDQVQVVLALEPLLDDVHVEQTQKAAAKAEIEGLRRLGFIGQRGVVELQALERFFEIGIVFALDRVHPGEDHGLGA